MTSARNRHLIEAQIPALRRFAHALARDAALADDLVQDCLLRALSRWHLLRSGPELRAWLFRVLRNLYIDALRSRRISPPPRICARNSTRRPRI